MAGQKVTILGCSDGSMVSCGKHLANCGLACLGFRVVQAYIGSYWHNGKENGKCYTFIVFRPFIVGLWAYWVI